MICVERAFPLEQILDIIRKWNITRKKNKLVGIIQSFRVDEISQEYWTKYTGKTSLEPNYNYCKVVFKNRRTV